VIKGILDTQKLISEKLGIKPESHKIKGQDDVPTPAKKTDADFYKEAGLKSTGRPLNK
jgi:type II restriction/modification system DNA methylase subunit YeeA